MDVLCLITIMQIRISCFVFLTLRSHFLCPSFIYISVPETGVEPVLIGYEPIVLASILLWNSGAQESNLLSRRL